MASRSKVTWSREMTKALADADNVFAKGTAGKLCRKLIKTRSIIKLVSFLLKGRNVKVRERVTKVTGMKVNRNHV